MPISSRLFPLFMIMRWSSCIVKLGGQCRFAFGKHNHQPLTLRFLRPRRVGISALRIDTPQIPIYGQHQQCGPKEMKSAKTSNKGGAQRTRRRLSATKVVLCVCCDRLVVWLPAETSVCIRPQDKDKSGYSHGLFRCVCWSPYTSISTYTPMLRSQMRALRVHMQGLLLLCFEETYKPPM